MIIYFANSCYILLNGWIICTNQKFQFVIIAPNFNLKFENFVNKFIKRISLKIG